MKKNIISISLILLILSCSIPLKTKKFNKDDVYKNAINEIYLKYNDIVLKEDMGFYRYLKYWEVFGYTLQHRYTLKYDMNWNLFEIKRDDE